MSAHFSDRFWILVRELQARSRLQAQLIRISFTVIRLNSAEQRFRLEPQTPQRRPPRSKSKRPAKGSQDARQPSPRTALPPRESIEPRCPVVHVTLVTLPVIHPPPWRLRHHAVSH